MDPPPCKHPGGQAGEAATSWQTGGPRGSLESVAPICSLGLGLLPWRHTGGSAVIAQVTVVPSAFTSTNHHSLLPLLCLACLGPPCEFSRAPKPECVVPSVPSRVVVGLPFADRCQVHSLRVAVQPSSFKFQPCFHMTLPGNPNCGEGDSRVHRAQQSVYCFWLLFLLIGPRVRFSECPKDIAVSGTTGSPVMHQDSRFLE